MNTLPFPLYRATQVRELDRIAIADMGVSGVCLMERAGSAAFHLLETKWPKANRIIVICGIGNNGGDGYVLARLAFLAGYDVTVLQLGDIKKLKGDAKIVYDAMTEVGLSVQVFAEKKLSVVDVVVDALLGTGLSREVRGEWKEVIEGINRCQCPVLSLDIPSGLHADTGNVMGAAVHAQATISFIGLKQGLFTAEGPEYCGEICFDDLKVPAEIYKQIKSHILRFDYNVLSHLLTRRSRTAHKGSFGHVLIIGGDVGMTGAVRLAAESALRVGAGKVTIATRQAHAALINMGCPEIMCHGIETPEQLEPLLESADVIAIGTGLGQAEWGQAVFDKVKCLDKPMVIDADALNLTAQSPCRFKNSIITPHPGEAARLLQTGIQEVQHDRFAAVQSLQLRFGGVCVLKGAGTLIADPKGDIGVCTVGNPGMAVGGSGDMLTGVIAGLLAQGLKNIDAARLGVCLHGQAGDKAAQQGERGMLPSDLLPWLRFYANPELIDPIEQQPHLTATRCQFSITKAH
ncbi:NAD(P)H-hydrate dehydratase [Candidatus Albibeggiatoa sp. nov. NOAA]|uniref:NAD(P)H-hydrate dehydratase n=1 Tax=Candidatus Albibeggiatoa sp. nov. NOAA TaxID=3162724 RepID=UPI0032F74F1B|nr:NAD(P)H-hydrate dehydratase [Thiotrichaceae bacterium]